MELFTPKVKMASVAGLTAVTLDYLWHVLATEPMESFDYFVVKAFLGFLVATLLLNWRISTEDVSNIYSLKVILWASAGFSFLMSLYYRWWEYFSNVPFSVRAPDILFINRENILLFGAMWFIAHGSFFLVGLFLARNLIRRSTTESKIKSHA